jgi:hypothetical protein
VLRQDFHYNEKVTIKRSTLTSKEIGGFDNEKVMIKRYQFISSAFSGGFSLSDGFLSFY